MTWTNRHNLPKPIVDVVTKDPYTKGSADVSITGLLQPARIRVLEKIHAGDLTEDVSDRIGSLLGRLMHKLLEEADSGSLAEERFYMTIEGVTVSGQTDAVYDNGLVQDYKLVPIRKFEHGVPDEYTQQLNFYAVLLRANGRAADTLEVVAVFKDWFKSGTTDPEYPHAQCVVYPVEVWDHDVAVEALRQRVIAHKAANTVLPQCTDTERWARPTKWAVMPARSVNKLGKTRSMKNFDTKDQAEAFSKTIPGSFVEIRRGKQVRCEDWCRVAPFCRQWKKLKKEQT